MLIRKLFLCTLLGLLFACKKAKPKMDNHQIGDLYVLKIAIKPENITGQITHLTVKYTDENGDTQTDEGQNISINNGLFTREYIMNKGHITVDLQANFINLQAQSPIEQNTAEDQSQPNPNADNKIPVSLNIQILKSGIIQHQKQCDTHIGEQLNCKTSYHIP